MPRSIYQNGLLVDENVVPFKNTTESRSSVASRGYLISVSLSPAMSGNQAALQTLTEQHQPSPDVFNADTFVTGMDGTVMASVPTSSRRIGVHYREGDHAVASLEEGKATVGDPVFDKVLNVPVVSMAVPIRDPQGKVIGGYWGLTDLAKPNFLDKISASRYGNAGGYLVVAPRARIIITATDKKRVLEVLPAAGVNRYVDRNIGGYEGYSVLVNALGEEQLASVKKFLRRVGTCCLVCQPAKSTLRSTPFGFASC